MFWFKRKEITLDLFTCIEKINRAHPPRRASAFMPDWWKRLGDYYEEPILPIGKTKKTGTMKFCSGFRDLYASGFIIPLWADLDLHVGTESFYWVFPNKMMSATYHDVQQHGNSFPDYHHIKLLSPWFAKEKTGIKFIYMEPTWSLLPFNGNVRMPPGVMSFNLQPALNLNILVRKGKEDYKLTLEADTPVAHLIPMTDKKVILKTHVVSEAEHVAIEKSNIATKFYKSYEIYRRSIKKCPR